MLLQQATACACHLRLGKWGAESKRERDRELAKVRSGQGRVAQQRGRPAGAQGERPSNAHMAQVARAMQPRAQGAHFSIVERWGVTGALPANPGKCLGWRDAESTPI